MFRKIRDKCVTFLKQKKVRDSLYIKHSSINSDEDTLPYLFCLVRNGTFFVDEFISHYRHLGFGNIYFIDNNSTDDLVASVKKYPNICVLGCDLPFVKFESEMRRETLKKFGFNKWCLCVDIDEFFDIPYIDKIGLEGIIGYLEKYQYNGVLFHMLDMYSKTSNENLYKSSSFDKSKFIYFSPNDIEKRKYESVHFKWYMRNNLLDSNQHFFFGGCRKRLFGTDNWLTKHALMFIEKGVEPFVHPHISNNLKIADISGALYHYHFADGFLDKVKSYVASKNVMHSEHERYLEAINQKGEFSFMDENTMRLESCDQLVDIKLLDISDKFLDYVSNKVQK